MKKSKIFYTLFLLILFFIFNDAFFCITPFGSKIHNFLRPPAIIVESYLPLAPITVKNKEDRVIFEGTP